MVNRIFDDAKCEQLDLNSMLIRQKYPHNLNKYLGNGLFVLDPVESDSISENARQKNRADLIYKLDVYHVVCLTSCSFFLFLKLILRG